MWSLHRTQTLDKYQSISENRMIFAPSSVTTTSESARCPAIPLRGSLPQAHLNVQLSRADHVYKKTLFVFALSRVKPRSLHPQPAFGWPLLPAWPLPQ